MDRALNLDVLATALDDQEGLPTPEELQTMLADAEVQLFRHRGEGVEIPDDLLDTAWYLHAIASVDAAQRRYTVARQRQAFAVSAHVFDIALAESRWQRTDRLQLAFAAAIGYRRGDRDPNATAIFRRFRADITTSEPLLDHIDTLALEAGLALLGFETRTLFAWFRIWQRQLRDLAALVELRDLSTTAYGTTDAVVHGAADLLHYLTRGDQRRLTRANETLLSATRGRAGPAEPLARWVAAHLLSLAGEASTGSVWSPELLPPDLPDAVRHAFTLASPPVLTFWNPQRALLTSTPSPFDPHVRRMVHSVPTSGGKTLIAQLLALSHLARNSTSVCYVAPTRSLCREVRRAFAGRLHVLAKETGPDLPDFPSPGQLPEGENLWNVRLAELTALPEPPDVEVLTPERLMHLLRHDAEAVLDRFGMFIFDEAQLIKEASRGFTLESIITFLHHRTRQTHHRIILLSAALGNATQILRWIDPDSAAEPFESQWRGPRRLHAAISTKVTWDDKTVTPSKGDHPYRHHHPLSGLIRLRPSDGREVRLVTRETVGTLVLKADHPEQSTGRKKDTAKSDPNYVIAARMIALIGHAGTALTVCPTRATAQRIALTLANMLPDHPPAHSLTDFVRTQLGDEHPLTRTLAHGVGFHHAGLPIEVLEALEDALRAETLPYLTCTSTLTDGVNLPVHTVVIYDENYDGMPEDARLQGPRMVNAVGRAGRAGKETEGWIVLARAADPSDADFADLAPTAEELTISSSIAATSVLQAIADLEQAAREAEDAVLRRASGAAADFVAFIWFYLADEETRGTSPDQVDIEAFVDELLAASQTPEHVPSFSAVAHAVQRQYMRTDPTARRRWPRTGTSIGSAQTIDTRARQLAELMSQLGAQDPDTLKRADSALELLAVTGTITTLLALPENTAPWNFRTTPKGAGFDVPVPAVLTDWLNGHSYAQLAQTHLAQMTDPGRRIEAMVDAVTGCFEHFLAWTVGALVELVNIYLADAESDHRLCPELGPYIRYGVNDPRALSLMLQGLRSRRLAHEIAQQSPEGHEPGGTSARDWLATMTISEWRQRFTATASEILDLLDLTRTRRRSLLRNLLENASASIDINVQTVNAQIQRGDLSLAPIPDSPEPAPIGVYSGTTLIGTVRPADHANVATILDSGMELDLRLSGSTLGITTPPQ